MKFLVQIKSIFNAGLFILLIGGSTDLFGQKNVCNCDDPPGGSVTCEEAQFAICKIQNGKVVALCITRPTNLSEVDLNVWILTQIKGTKASVQDLASKENQEILETGRWSGSGVIATFTPDSTSQTVLGKFEGFANSEAFGEIPLTINLQSANGKLTGTIETPQGPAGITDGTYAAGKIKFKFDAGGNEGTVTGTLNGGKIVGKWELGGTGGTLELKKTRTTTPTHPPSGRAPTPTAGDPQPTPRDGRLISCRERRDQAFVCLYDAVAEVKPNLGKHIYIVAYGGAERIPCTGRKYANAFRRQLADAIKAQGIQVDESLIKAVDGGFRDEASIEVYVYGSGEQPPTIAKWPPNCRQ